MNLFINLKDFKRIHFSSLERMFLTVYLHLIVTTALHSTHLTRLAESESIVLFFFLQSLLQSWCWWDPTKANEPNNQQGCHLAF